MRFDLTDEEKMIQKTARDFTIKVIEPLVEKIENENKTPRDLLKKLADVGFLGLTIPAEYGGSGGSILADVLVLEEIAKAGIGMEWLVSANNSSLEAILHNGSDALKMKYIPPVCRGEQCMSVMFTEPDTGSDPALVKTKALPAGDNYLLNGQKRFISWGAWDGPALVFAKDETEKVSCFLVEKNGPGYTTDPPWKKVGGHAQESVDVHFENVQVPKVNIIGEKGKGFNILLWWVGCEKIEQAAAALGMAEAALEESIKYSKGRNLKSGPMANLQGIQWTLAEMQAKIESIRWLIYKCACLRQELAPNWSHMAALLKTIAIPTATEVTLMGMRIHAAYGYTKEYKIGRLHQSVLGGLGILTAIELNKSIVGAGLVR